jgi:RluA family pseudouridine synthase
MLTVLTERPGLVAIAKPPGRIVIPGRGAAAGEEPLRDELARQLGRPVWVVHRLDRGTSGVLVFATSAEAHRALSRAFERHAVSKRYWALVKGALYGQGEIDRALGPARGGLVRVVPPGAAGGKPSRTSYRAIERLRSFTVVELRPETGRLHQVRAHAAALGHPLAVDPDYGGASRLTAADLLGAEPSGPDEVILDRVPLHALSLKLPALDSGGPALVIDAPLAPDLERALELLRR